MCAQGGFSLKPNPTLFSEGRGAAQGAAATRSAAQDNVEPPQQRRAGASLLARAVAAAVNPERNAPRRPISERLQRLEELPRKVSRGQPREDAVAVAASSPPRKGRWGPDDEAESDAEEEKARRHKKHKKHRRN